MDPMKQKTPSTSSYAQVAQQTQFPTREQAIVLDSVEGISIQEYTVAIGKITDPKNIRFVSRISHGRVCLYLNSKENADKLTESNKKVVIGQHALEIRPLISKAKRIILSNVCPIIPHHIVQEELIKHNIRLSSQITFIRAGINDPSYAHVLSFRRQVYIHPEDVTNLPDVLQINFDSVNYWIYLSTEKLSCFLCKEEGHLAKFCKNANTAPQHSPNLSILSNEGISVTSTPCVKEKISSNRPIASEDKLSSSEPNSSLLLMPPPATLKRPLTPSTSTTESVCSPEYKQENDASTNIKKKVTKQKTKKIKTGSKKNKSEISITDLYSQMLPAKDLISKNSVSYPLDFDDIIDFLLTTYDNPKVMETALKYTQDIPALTVMLSEVKDLLSERNLKSRIIRILKKLINSNANSDLEDGSSTDSCSMDTQDL